MAYHTHTFYREVPTGNEDEVIEVPVVVTYTISKYYPARYHGPSMGPAEGGEVEIVSAKFDGGQSKSAIRYTFNPIDARMTDAEEKEWRTYLEENPPLTGPDPDAAHDRWRDEHHEAATATDVPDWGDD